MPESTVKDPAALPASHHRVTIRHIRVDIVALEASHAVLERSGPRRPLPLRLAYSHPYPSTASAHNRNYLTPPLDFAPFIRCAPTPSDPIPHAHMRTRSFFGYWRLRAVRM